MSADLTAAVDAAAEYQFGLEAARLGIDAEQVGQAWDDAEPIVKHAYRESVLGPVAAAAPVIEAQALRDAARAIGDEAASSDYLADHVSDDGLAWFMRRLRERADEIAGGVS